MKIYTIPEELPAPVVDYHNYDFKKAEADEEKHQAALVEWLQAEGYTGELTGKIYNHAMGDGYARYMFADSTIEQCLIVLPYGDAWDHPDVEYLPVEVIIERIKAAEKRRGYFRAKKAERST